VRTGRLPAAVLVLAGALSGCGGHAATVATAPPGQALTVTVLLTSAGCSASPAVIGNGPTTFAASNSDDTATSEVGLARDGVVLAENEGVGPGLQGSFALDLTAGSYELLCPRVTGPPQQVAIRVVAVPRPALTGAALQRAQALAAAVAGYRTYLARQTAALVSATTAFERAVLAGNVAQAKALYAAARAPYERIEPVAESFPDLDTVIDARQNDVPAGQDWAGFHRLEYALYDRGSLAGTAFYAENLLADVSVLQARVATLPLQPAQLADGAVSLLDEVGRTKVTGEEERYSHLDLVDFQANVDGAAEAFELLAPALPSILAAQVRQRLATMDAALDRYRTGPGVGAVVPYQDVDAAQRQQLAADVDALAAPMSQLAGALG
jgi:iron uptake system component EfeO